jgi:hypothetical protein
MKQRATDAVFFVNFQYPVFFDNIPVVKFVLADRAASV